MCRLRGARSGGRDVDDTSPAFLFHRREAGADHAERAAQVDIDDIFPIVITVAIHQLMHRNAGTVNENVRRAKVVIHPLHEPVDGCVRGDVQRIHEARLADQLFRLGGRIFVAALP